MMQDDEQIEALLRTFQPRAPRTLPAAETGRPTVWAWAWVAVAAAMVLFTANLRFMPMASLAPGIVGISGLTVDGMRRLLDADPATLDRALLEASQGVLPDVEAPDSALGRFAQP